MELQAHSIVFKDDEGERLYSALVKKANSKEGRWGAAKKLAFLNLFVERLEAGDCFIEAQDKARSKYGLFSSVYYEILCPHWEHGEWLQKAIEKSTSYEERAAKLATPLNCVIGGAFLIPTLPFFGLSTLGGFIDNESSSEHVKKVGGAISAVFSAPAYAITSIAFGLCSANIALCYLPARLYQKGINEKYTLPR